MLSSSSSAMVGSFGFPWGFQASSSFDSGRESEINHLIYTPKTSLESLALIAMLFSSLFPACQETLQLGQRS